MALSESQVIRECSLVRMPLLLALLHLYAREMRISLRISAIVGTCLSFRKMKSQSYLETTCYVLMGLTILIAFKPFYDSCGLEIVLWVIGEGIAYITGAVLYSFKKIPYIHSVFHIFVILGDVCHMIATWKVIQMFVL